MIPDSTQVPAAPPTHRIIIELAIEAATPEAAREAVEFAIAWSYLQDHIDDAHGAGQPFAHAVSATVRLDTLTCQCCGHEAGREQMTVVCEDGGECDARQGLRERAT